MGSINIEGLGIVEIEGDEPNEAEQTAIINALQDTPEEPRLGPIGVMPEKPEQAAEPVIEEAPKEPREGPLGIMPAEARGAVREKIEEQPGLVQLLTEISPSIGGALGGAAMGAPFGPVGAIGGAILGGVGGEVFAQETGLAPESELNIALAAGGPLLGPTVGGAFRGARRVVGKGVSKLPFARTARARNVMSQAVEEFESLGTRIIEKQRGLLSRKSSELYDTVRRAGVIVPPKSLQGTQTAIKELSGEMQVISAFPEVRQAMKVLDNVSKTLDGTDVSMDTLVTARQIVGKVIERTEKTGGIKLGAAKKVFKEISDDLDKIANDPSLTGRAARVAQAATKRAKLEFAVKDMEAGVSRFVTDIPDGVQINIKGFQKWFRNITNPKSKQYNKNFSSALKDDIPEITERLKELAKITDAGSPGGPGSLVVRGRFSKVGATLGGLLGFGTSGGIGAATGAVLGASAPEMLTSLLMTKPGAAFLNRAVNLGKGQINQKTWIAIGQFATRAAGEQSESIDIQTPEAL